MLSLINDVLEMSRIESGKLEIIPEPMNLPTVMNELKDLFETQMQEKGLTFVVDASQITNGCVLCDKTRFNRVLLNLVGNAYKFTPEGGSVEVRLIQLDDAPEGFGNYELRVKDSGIGMSEDFMQRVFDAFERERNTTASGIQGTGLGMAISKRIVEGMGGTIEVSSEQDKGTEFVVRLQLELLSRSADASDLDAGCRPPTQKRISFEGMRALLVEDNAINREIATMVLDNLGFSVDEAVDGKQALDLLISEPADTYDIVITDIQMPVMDGYEEARAIRALDDPARANVPIVAMSANAFHEDVRASKEAGMNAHVTKPIDIDGLSNTLAEVLA